MGEWIAITAIICFTVLCSVWIWGEYKRLTTYKEDPELKELAKERCRLENKRIQTNIDEIRQKLPNKESK